MLTMGFMGVFLEATITSDFSGLSVSVTVDIWLAE